MVSEEEMFGDLVIDCGVLGPFLGRLCEFVVCGLVGNGEWWIEDVGKGRGLGLRCALDDLRSDEMDSAGALGDCARRLRRDLG